MKLVAIALAVCLGCGNASARPGSSYAALSSGQESCGQYLESDATGKTVFEEWVLGFISGTNYAKGESVGVRWDAASMRVWLEQYCQANPLKPVTAAAEGYRLALINNG